MKPATYQSEVWGPVSHYTQETPGQVCRAAHTLAGLENRCGMLVHDGALPLTQGHPPCQHLIPSGALLFAFHFPRDVAPPEAAHSILNDFKSKKVLSYIELVSAFLIPEDLCPRPALKGCRE